MSLFIALKAPEDLSLRLDALLAHLTATGHLSRATSLRPLGGKAPFHLTLAFLGSPSPEGRVCALEALAALEGMAAPRLSVRGLFGLPPRKRHSVLCLGLEETPPAGRLLAIHQALNRRLRELEEKAGIGALNADWPSRPLLPHLSVARPASGSFLPADAAEASLRLSAFPLREGLEAPQIFDSCILYESSGSRGGSSYRELAACCLGTGEGGFA